MNYEETARTNYFRIKDPAAFRKELETIWGIAWVEERGEKEVALFFDDGMPSERQITDEDGEAYEEFEAIDFMAWLASHVEDGDVAVVMGAGHEGYRYVVGYAYAVNSRGETVLLNTDDIYARATELLDDPTAVISLAEY